MVVVDLGEFSSEAFDPKAWINAALESRHQQESLDRFLSDLEETLRSSSEKIGDALERESSDAIRRVPLACRDVVHLRNDAVALRLSVSSILLKLKKAEETSSESVAALSKIDNVKQRMESAYETLQDAAGLTQLSASVEDVFASGDLPRAADTLANMRHCLSVVGEVAEFANVRKQLEILEDRLEEMVQPRLLDALTNRKVEEIQNLRRILIRIGRFNSLELQYIKMHVKPLKKLWDGFVSKHQLRKLGSEAYLQDLHVSNPPENAPSVSFSSWMSGFYDEVLLYLEQEWRWCSNAFPDDYKSLVPKLLIEAMSELNSGFASCINLATGIIVPETKTLGKGILDIISGEIPNGTKIQSKHLDALIELHNMTSSFARNIQYVFSESELSVLQTTLKAIYFPYEAFKQRYAQMERAILSSKIVGIDIRGAVGRAVGAQGIELSETVRRMEESIPQVIVLLEGAVDRCINFTGGSEADDLILVLDDSLLLYISNLQEALKSLRAVCGLDPIMNTSEVLGAKKDSVLEKRIRTADVVSEEEWSIVQGALQVLTVSDSLTSRASVFEASLRATLARIGTSLSLSNFDQFHGATVEGYIENSVPGRAGVDVVALRLSNFPEKGRKLFNLLEQSKDPRFHVLPLASQKVATFADAVNELVYDVLISKVRHRLSEVSQLSIWFSVEEPSARPLPSFSAYPQPYVISVGEYLLNLPQQLEPLMESYSSIQSSTDEAQFFATEWIFKVADGAAGLFTEQLRGIHYLTDRGSQQLLADIEYLISVLSALSMPVTPFLATYRACLSAPRELLRVFVKSAGSQPELLSGSEGGEALRVLMKPDGDNKFDLPTAHLVCKIRRVAQD